MTATGAPKPPPSDFPSLHDVEFGAVDRYCHERQTAILAIMFTDLKGSSQLAEKQGEIAAQDLRHTHDALLRAIIERDAAGKCLKNIGDSLLCVFAKPTEAVARAVEIQQALTAHNRQSPERPIEVRIGIHMGQVVVEDVVQRDVFGRHVNRAARVESLADGGQILVSHSVYDSASGWLTDVTWHEHGSYALKGIREPERIYEVGYPGSPPWRRPRGQRAASDRALFVAGVLLFLIAAGLIGAAWPLLRAPTAPLTVELQVASDRADAPLRRFPAAPPIQGSDLFRFDAKASRPCYLRIVAFDPDDGCTLIGSSGKQRATHLGAPAAAGSMMRISGSPGYRLVLAVGSDAPITDEQLVENLSLPAHRLPAAASVTWVNPKGLLQEPELRSFEEVIVEPGLQKTLAEKARWLTSVGLVFEGVAFPRQ